MAARRPTDHPDPADEPAMSSESSGVPPANGGGLGYSLLHAAQTWRTEATSVLKPHGLTVPQFLVVMALFRQARHGWDPLTQAELGKRLGMDANTASQIVRGLAARGVLERSRHPSDARALAVALTPDGLERAAAAGTAARVLNDLYFSPVSGERLVALGETLEILSTESEKRA
jgi:DNA-binding MarR family transcriptional regulator